MQSSLLPGFLLQFAKLYKSAHRKLDGMHVVHRCPQTSRPQGNLLLLWAQGNNVSPGLLLQILTGEAMGGQRVARDKENGVTGNCGLQSAATRKIGCLIIILFSDDQSNKCSL